MSPCYYSCTFVGWAGLLGFGGRPLVLPDELLQLQRISVHCSHGHQLTSLSVDSLNMPD